MADDGEQSHQIETPAQTPGPSTDTTQTGSSSSSKYAFKQCPRFEPTYYLGWASEVRDAFAERDWTEYLIPTEGFVPNPQIVARAKAFLSQAISYEHKAGMEHCKTAGEMYKSLDKQYGTATCEDELRLETQLIYLRKSATDTIEQHISKFKLLIASVMAQQADDNKYRKDKRNQLFLATLEYAKIPDENWQGLVPYLGRTWTDMEPESLFAATRTFYYAHILPTKPNSVLANERTQIRSDPIPGRSVDTLGGYQVGRTVTRSESDAARAGWDGGKTRPG